MDDLMQARLAALIQTEYPRAEVSPEATPGGLAVRVRYWGFDRDIYHFFSWSISSQEEWDEMSKRLPADLAPAPVVAVPMLVTQKAGPRR